MTPVITLQSVTKVFRTYHHYHAGLKSLALNPRLFSVRGKRDIFLAIDRLSLTIYQGETFGILGRNGAGKSTLLSLIAGVLHPTSGTILIQGRISPLLELGVGFAPDLTGIENILMNGVLLGLRRREVQAKIDSIIDFSGLHAFIDQPLKTYSSGMQIRLGFATAIHAQPDILLIDEVLAVGDAEFQEKCLERIATLRKRGATIVFVSHDLLNLKTICDRAAWIDRGRVAALGAPREVIARYQSELTHVAAPTDQTAAVCHELKPLEAIGADSDNDLDK